MKKRLFSLITTLALLAAFIPQLSAGAYSMGKVGEYQTISAGDFHTAAIKEDGSLWTWGYNYCGQLGDGTTEDKTTPVKIMDNVVAVSVGEANTVAMKSDSSLWTWGGNSYGQFGNGTITEGKTTPVKIMDNVAAISAGGHTAAIKEDGSLWTWGYNDCGQLGDGTTENKNTPIKIMDGVRVPRGGSRPSLSMPTDINNVTINHKGTAYGYFIVTDPSGNILKNTSVSYSIDGGKTKTGKTDDYGYLCVKINNVTKSHDYSIQISGNGVNPASGVLAVTVKPLEFTSEYEATLTKGASVGLGIGIGGSIGNLEAEAEAAEIGASGSNKKGFSYSQERKNGKTKLVVTAKENTDVAAKAKVGLWAGEKFDKIQGAEISAGDIHGSAKYGNTSSVGFEDDDFNIGDFDDTTKLAEFMLCALLENMDSNVATRWLLEKLDFKSDTYEKGSTVSLAAGASIGSVKLKSGSKEIVGETIGGIDGSSVWSQSTKTSKDGIVSRKSGVSADAGVKLFDIDIKQKEGNTSVKASTSGLGKKFINNKVLFSAENDKNGDLTSLGITWTDDDSSNILWTTKSTSTTRSITYSDSKAEKVASSYSELNDFAYGNKYFFTISQMSIANNTMTNSDQTGVFSESAKKTKGVDLNASASVQLFLKLGGEAGISGTESYSYETENGIYENNTVYTQAKNDVADAVEDEFFGVEDAFSAAANYMGNLIGQFWDTISGWVDDAVDVVVDAGKAVVKKVGDTITGWKVSVTKAIDDIMPFAILAVDSEISLFSTSSVATTVGSSYIVSVEDESGNAVTDLSSNPLLLILEYTDEELAAAGVEDINDVSIYRWDEDKCVYVRMGGEHDAVNKLFSLEIVKTGQYILAADNCPPAVTEFKASHSGSDPDITAIVSDMSGIEDLRMTIDGETVVDNNNLSGYYDFTTAEFKYPTSGLSEGMHTAVIYARDTSGNELADGVTLEFTINTDAPAISNVTELSPQSADGINVSANVTGKSISGVYLNVEEVSARGGSVRSSYEMTGENGIYTASADNFHDGTMLTVWVSAYSEDGNAAQSEQQTVMYVSDKPTLVFTNIDNSSVSVEAVNCDDIMGGTIILAVYDTDGALKNVFQKNFAQTVTFDDLDLTDRTVKAMLWDDIGSMKPLAAAA